RRLPLCRRSGARALFAADRKAERGASATDRKICARPNSSGKALPGRALSSTIAADNLVSILSRVAEGKGPLKPQQPVSRKGDAGAKSHPVRPGEIRSCPARLFFSTPGRGFFVASPTSR